MSWLAIKTVLARAKRWALTHWELLAGLGLGLVVLIAFRQGAPDLTKLYASVRERSKKEQEEITAGYEKEVKLTQEAATRAADALQQVEEHYAQRSEELDRKKKKEVKKIIEETKRDPEELARKLAQATGARYVPRGKNEGN